MQACSILICLDPLGQQPSFKVSMENLTMFEDMPITLKCRVDTKKLSINVTWYKDDIPISSSHARYNTRLYKWGSRLKIRHAVAMDSGMYQCFVQGPGGTVEAQAWLKIRQIGNTGTPFTGSTLRPTSRSAVRSVKGTATNWSLGYIGLG